MLRDEVLSLLKSGEELSGEAMSQTLGVSRAAVWKAIEALRGEGYAISSAPRRGYRLEGSPDLLSAGELAAVAGRRVGKELVCLETVDSTNNEVKRRAVDAVPDGLGVLAGEQTGGRGRRGRSFVSPAGKGLYLSALLRPDCPLEQVSALTAWTAVAVCDAVEELCGIRPGIKWPNDVILDGRKLCGILTEATIEGETGTVSSLVVGIGINLHPNPAWPEEVQAVAGAISDFGKPPRRAELAAAVLNHFEDVYMLLEQGKEPELLEQYRERLCCIGRPVTVISPAGRYEAECVGLDEEAHLLVKTADGQAWTVAVDA